MTEAALKLDGIRAMPSEGRERLDGWSSFLEIQHSNFTFRLGTRSPLAFAHQWLKPSQSRIRSSATGNFISRLQQSVNGPAEAHELQQLSYEIYAPGSTTAKPNTSYPAPVDFSMRLCCCHLLTLASAIRPSGVREWPCKDDHQRQSADCVIPSVVARALVGDYGPTLEATDMEEISPKNPRTTYAAVIIQHVIIHNPKHPTLA